MVWHLSLQAFLLWAIGACQGQPSGLGDSKPRLMLRSAVQLPAPVHPNDVVLLDANRDNVPEIITAGVLERSLWITDVTTGARRQIPTRGAVIDIDPVDPDSDGRQEFLLTIPEASVVEIRALEADLRAPVIAQIPMTADNVLVDDLDGDGRDDLVGLSFGSHTLQIWRNEGNFDFAPMTTIPTGLGPSDAILADADGDGNLDIVLVCSQADTVELYSAQMNPTGPAATIAVPSWPVNLALADTDADGVFEIYGSANLGAAFFEIHRDLSVSTTPTHAGPFGLTAADLDGDGDHELVVAEKFAGSLSVYARTNDGLSVAATVATSAGPTPTAIGDVTGDGVADIVSVTGFDDRIEIIRVLGQ